MWEQSLIESKPATSTASRWWIFPVSALAHVAIIAAVIGSAYWYVEAMAEPVNRIDVVFHSASPPPAYGNESERASHREKTQKIPVAERIVPEIEREQDVPAEGEQVVEKGCDPCGDQGVPWGIPGGDPEVQSPGSFFGPGDGEDLPVVMTPEIRQPVLIRRVEPVYPRSALRMRITGIVILEAVISKTGTVEGLRVLRSDHELLQTAAIEAVQQWLYQPATFNGRPIKVYFTVTVHFLTH